MTVDSSATRSPWTARRVVLATLVVLSVLLCFYLLARFYVVVFTLFVAIVIAVAIRPLVDWLRERGLPRPIGVLLVYLALFALVAGFFYLLTPLLADQITNIVRRFPEYYRRLTEAMLTSSSGLIQRLGMQLPGNIQLVPGAVAPPATAAGQQPSVAGGGSLSALGSLLSFATIAIHGLFVATSILVLAYYWVLDGERTVRGLLLRVPVERRESIQEIIDSAEEKVGAYVRGVVILSAAVGVMAAVAYLVIGLPYALVLGLIAAVLEVVPVIGPVLGAVPPVLLALSTEPGKAIWVVLAVILVQQIESNLLVPRVMDRAVGVNAIVTILSIAAFGSLFGLAGAIMAIPLAAIIQVLLNRFVFSTSGVPVPGPEGRDRVSLLRYEAQKLVQDVRKQVREKDGEAAAAADRVEDMIEAIAMDIDGVLAQAELPEVAR